MKYKGKLDIGVLEIYDEKLIDLGNKIHKKKKIIYKRFLKKYFGPTIYLFQRTKNRLKLISKVNLI